jgi:preprotein translocase subunit SecA
MKRRLFGHGEQRTSTVLSSLSISSAGTVLRQKTKINFGGEGLSLSELSNVAATLRGTSPSVPARRPKVGRNDPCPCGSGKKFKKCCAS